MRLYKIYSLFTFLFLSTSAWSAMDNSQRSVWVNEAIVSTYTYDYKNFLQRQKEIAKYFTAEGWIAYSKALNESKIPELVQKKSYVVSAVATLPPVIKLVNNGHWEASMPILVLYKNDQNEQQTQYLMVTVNITQVEGQGIRGLAIASFQSKVTTPSCQCPENDKP